MLVCDVHIPLQMKLKKQPANPFNGVAFGVLTLLLLGFAFASVGAQEPISRDLSCLPPEQLDLPEITGAFRLVFDGTFHDVSDSYLFYSIFHWTSADLQDSIYLGHRNRVYSFYQTEARTEFQVITNGGPVGKCRAYADLAANVMYSFEVTLFADSSGTIKISNNGAPVGDGTYYCAAGEITVPSDNITRQHYLGNSPFDATNPTGYRRMRGGISGIQLTKPGTVTHPRDRYKFWNFPGQPYNNGFVTSFYARFDDLINRQFQMVFDFGNGAGVDNILCTQESGTTRMRCDVVVGGTFYTVIGDPGSLVEGEMAHWEFGVDTTAGLYWINKDGSEIATATLTAPASVFRSGQKFLHSHWGTDYLDGVVLGLRVTTLQTS